tara:strand:- start:223 stop:672 length:450 start_codon:yes stop_codon:yes gene_type:complete
MKNKKSLQFNLNMGKLISSAHNMMTKRFVKNANKAGLDISLDQWMVLGPISFHGDASQKLLSDASLKDKASITRIVSTLEKKNLVVRVPDQIDHRVNRVVLTAAGKKLLVDAIPIMNKTREEVASGIPETEIQVFKDVLAKIISNLEND